MTMVMMATTAMMMDTIMNHNIEDKYVFTQADTNQVAFLYDAFIKKYFPKDEVKPLSHIKRMMEAGYYKIITISSSPNNLDEAKGNLTPIINKVLGVAFITAAPNCSIYLLDYLAIDKNYRSKGIGGLLLQEVAEKYVEDKPLLIETESIASSKSMEEKQMRLRRNAFYEKNAATLTDLVTEIYGVEYTIWIMNEKQLDLIDELSKLYHFMVDDKHYESKVFIPKR